MLPMDPDTCCKLKESRGTALPFKVRRAAEIETELGDRSVPKGFTQVPIYTSQFNKLTKTQPQTCPLAFQDRAETRQESDYGHAEKQDALL